MQSLTNLSQEWSEIKDLMQQNRFGSVVSLSGKMLEGLLKKVILDYARYLPYKQRSQLNRLEEELGKGNKGIESFELGPLVQIVTAKEVDFTNAVSHLTKKDSKILKSVNFGYLKELRNKYTHSPLPVANPVDIVGALATKAEAQYYISSLEILSSFFDIELIDYAGVMNELDRLRADNVALQEENGSFEEVNGLVAYYRRYAEIENGMDYRDTCYYAEHDPFSMSVPELRDLYERVHYRDSSPRQVRVVLNLSNKKTIPFLLFYRFVKDYQGIKERKIQTRYMRCHTDSNQAVFIVHTVLLYSAREIDNGYLVLSMFDNERRQRNLIIRHRRLFDFYRTAYRELFNSCDPLEIEGFKNLYLETYGNPQPEDIDRNVRDYYSTIPHNEDDISQAIAAWRSILLVPNENEWHGANTK